MGISRSVAGTVLLLLSLASAPRAAAEGKAAPAPRPLPVDKTRKLIEEEAVYTVEGRVRIKKGIEVTVLRNVKIQGTGSGPAVIEVEGGFDCIGVLTREVILENVTVEPCPKFERVHMDMAIFRGSGGIRTPKDVPAEGAFMLENFDMVGQTAMDVTLQAGEIELSSACFDNPTRLRVVPQPGKDKDQVRVFVRGCHQEPKHRCSPHGGRVGLVGGLESDGGDDVTIQLSRIGGSLCSVKNWGQRLIFDGNKVNSAKLEFSHRKAGQYQRVQCAKLDIYSSEVSASAPPDPVLKDTFSMDRCWFKGFDDPRAILEKVVKDGADDPKNNGVRVTFPKINTRPLELAGAGDR
jgi:hypothetical protein